MKVKVKVTQSCPNSPGQNTGVGRLSLLQGIFLTQGSNTGLPHCRQILYQLSHKGRPIILEWVACPFSSGSSWPRNRTRVFCIAGGFFTNWAPREALIYVWKHKWSYICIWIWDMKWGKSAKQNEGRLRTLIQERKKTGS